jgi:hypothetical protein
MMENNDYVYEKLRNFQNLIFAISVALNIIIFILGGYYFINYLNK